MRISEEQNNKYCNHNPFLVPDDYFINFTQNLMNNLPEKKNIDFHPHMNLWQRVRPLVYLAAMFCGIILCVRTFVSRYSDNSDRKASLSYSISEEEAEVIIDNSMIDDYELYTYLNNNSNNDEVYDN